MITEEQVKRRDGRRGDAGDDVLKPSRNGARRHAWFRPIATITVAGLTLFLGYGDLWRGGDTVSAMLLTVGYIIMVPIAIMAGPRARRAQE